MVDIHDTYCLDYTCTRLGIYNFDGRSTAAYCDQHAEAGMVNIWSHQCLHDSCTKQPNFNSDGWQQTYCKLHAEQRTVVRSANSSRTVVGAAVGVRIDGVYTACAMVKREVSDSPVSNVSVGAPCEEPGCLKRSGRGSEGKRPILCPDHAPLEDRHVVGQSVQLARVKVEYHTPQSSLVSKTQVDDNGDGSGTAARRTHH